MAEVVTSGGGREPHYLIGRTIVGIRAMTRAELADESWGGDSGRAIILDNGTTIFAAQREESRLPANLYARLARGTVMLSV